MKRQLYAEDCLATLSNELAIPSASIDLIYLDPPFNSNSKYNLPFKGKYKNARPVMAFEDAWEWGDKQEKHYEELKSSGQQGKYIADFIGSVRGMQRLDGIGGRKEDLSAYLVNMSIRLIKMRTVLKETGSIYLHCDPTASHYLKVVMDCIFGIHNKDCFNEIIWTYGLGGSSKKMWSKKHDVILFYKKSKDAYFNKPLMPSTSLRMAGKPKGMIDVWTDIPSLNNQAKERIGYPTQKPFHLLERIIKASAPQNGIVLDPFCGCGTAIEVAEKLKRQWIGIDISSFAAGLIRERVIRNCGLEKSEIVMYGIPTTIDEAKNLAKDNPFEFEKWVCGAIGAYGMYHPPGTKGADRGVDGILDFYPMSFHQKKIERKRAIIQVKGGKVLPDNVKALYQTILDTSSQAGVLVCFADQIKTVENNRKTDVFKDYFGEYPIIQGFTIEQLLRNEKLKLPQYQKREEAKSVKLV